jgi:Asp-tRNA(Asn)/Glu-tRNA(Gln) amidotransferase A subunit family amidase
MAEQVLRDTLAGEIREEAKDAASSLERILIHVSNMQSAIETTPACRMNVAKRLKDFSVTTARMATKLPRSAEQLEKLTEALRAAGTQVGEVSVPVEDSQQASAA